MDIRIEHRSQVRGGGNAYARLHIHIVPADRGCKDNADELRAMFEPWAEAFGVEGKPYVGWWLQLNTRREFAVLPAVIRRAIAAGFDMQLSLWDVLGSDTISLSKQPADFWREVALAQTFFES